MHTNKRSMPDFRPLTFGGGQWPAKSKRPKCSTPFCRNKKREDGNDCPKCNVRKWRASQMISSAWATHRDHAKERKIPVEWNREEFRLFCLLTGYHLTRKDGMTIERKNALLGYSLLNCECIPQRENSIKGATIDKWIRQKISGMLRQNEKQDRVA